MAAKFVCLTDRMERAVSSNPYAIDMSNVVSFPVSSKIELVFDDLDEADPVVLRARAVAYAKAGMAIFPLSPGTKTPLTGSKGYLDATIDQTKIEAWWPG